MTPAQVTAAQRLFRSEWGNNPRGPVNGVVAKLFTDNGDQANVIWCLYCVDLCLSYNQLSQKDWAPSPTLASMLVTATQAYYADQ